MAKEPSLLSFLSLPLEIRSMIYRDLFTKPFDMRPVPRQGREEFLLIGGRRTGRQAELPVDFLRASRQVSDEACEVLYGLNRFHLFAVEHSDIYNFLTKIGNVNRRRIRYLKIDWVYGVLECTENGGVQNILDNLDDTRVFIKHGSNPFWHDIWRSLLRYRRETAEYITETLRLLSEGHGLKELSVIMPGRNGADVQVGLFDVDITDERYDMAYFGWEIFHHEPEIRKALGRIRGLEVLSVGNTACLGEVEDVARDTGAKSVSVSWTDSDLRQESNFEKGDSKEKMTQRGWTVDIAARMACKPLHYDSLFSDPRDFIAWRHCHCRQCGLKSYSYEALTLN